MGNSAKSPADVSDKELRKLRTRWTNINKKGNDDVKLMLKYIFQSEEFSLKSARNRCIYTGFDLQRYREALEHYGIEPKLYIFDKYSIKVSDKPFETLFIHNNRKLKKIGKKTKTEITDAGDSWDAEKKENINDSVQRLLCGLDTFDAMDTSLDIVDAITDIGYGVASACNGLNDALIVIGISSLVFDVMSCVASQSRSESEKEGGSVTKECNGSLCCISLTKPTAFLFEYAVGTILQSIIIGSGIDEDNTLATILGYTSFIISIILGVVKGWNLRYELKITCFHQSAECSGYGSNDGVMGCSLARNFLFLCIVVIGIFGLLALTPVFQNVTC